MNKPLPRSKYGKKFGEEYDRIFKKKTKDTREVSGLDDLRQKDSVVPLPLGEDETLRNDHKTGTKDRISGEKTDA